MLLPNVLFAVLDLSLNLIILL